MAGLSSASLLFWLPVKSFLSHIRVMQSLSFLSGGSTQDEYDLFTMDPDS
jgi:hypothetical protein